MLRLAIILLVLTSPLCLIAETKGPKAFEDFYIGMPQAEATAILKKSGDTRQIAGTKFRLKLQFSRGHLWFVALYSPSYDWSSAGGRKLGTLYDEIARTLLQADNNGVALDSYTSAVTRMSPGDIKLMMAWQEGVMLRGLYLGRSSSGKISLFIQAVDRNVLAEQNARSDQRAANQRTDDASRF